MSFKLSLSLSILFLFLVAIREMKVAISIGTGLSAVVDSYNEADAIRGGISFAKLGFLSNAGLPDVSFGERYPGMGSVSKSSRHILTHYPPGPYWWNALVIRVFGEERFFIVRYLNVLIGVSSLAFFCFGLYVAMGRNSAVFSFAFTLLAPMTTNAFHGVNYEGLALSLLLVQWGFVMVGKHELAAHFVLGFMQGLLSLDFFFLVSLSSIPIALCIRQNLAIKSASTACCGFLLAFFLHFLQVAVYYGDLSSAFLEFFRAGLMRMNGPVPELLAHEVTFWPLFLKHLLVFLPQQKFLSDAWIFVLGLFSLTGLTGKIQWRDFLGTILAVAVSSSWIFVMRQHSAIHSGFIPRHFILLYVCVVLITILRLSELKQNIANVIGTQKEPTT